MTRLATGLTFAAAIGSGIVAGVFFAFSSFVMTALARISPAQAVAAMNSINMSVINRSFMTMFIGTGLLCLALGIGSLFMWNQGGSKLILAASLIYLVGVFGTTAAYNVPLNDKLGAFTDPAQAVAFWPNYLAAWTLWNHIRTIAAAASAILFTLVLRRS